MNLRPEYPVGTDRLRLRPLALDDIDTLLTYRATRTCAATRRSSR